MNENTIAPVDAISIENKELVYRHTAGNNHGVLETNCITSFLLSNPPKAKIQHQVSPPQATLKSELEIHPKG